MQFEMIDSNVMCLPLDDDLGTSSGGIVLPDQMKSKPVKAKVVSVGPGDHLENGSRCPMTIKVEDIVVFVKKSGDPIYINGKEYICIPEKYISFIIKE